MRIKFIKHPNNGRVLIANEETGKIIGHILTEERISLPFAEVCSLDYPKMTGEYLTLDQAKTAVAEYLSHKGLGA